MTFGASFGVLDVAQPATVAINAIQAIGLVTNRYFRGSEQPDPSKIANDGLELPLQFVASHCE